MNGYRPILTFWLKSKRSAVGLPFSSVCCQYRYFSPALLKVYDSIPFGFKFLVSEEISYFSHDPSKIVCANKRKPTFGSHFEIFPGLFNLSVYIFGKFRLFYVSGEEIVEKDARMSLIRLFEHI